MNENKDMVQRDEQPNLEHVRDERRMAPPVDVYENNDELLLKVDVPGVEHSGLDIHLDNGKLDLEARQAKSLADELGYEPLVYARSFAVPSSIDPAKVSAELDRGVLTVHLPKTEAAKPRRIQVTG